MVRNNNNFQEGFFMYRHSIILSVCLIAMIAGCQQMPVVLSIPEGVADPVVQAVVDRVSQEHYQRYQLAIESMGLGLYGGKEYNLGYRNRDISGTYCTLGNQEACLYLQDKFKDMGLAVSVQGKYKNVVGELKGATTPEKIYIIGSHYDHIEGDMPGGDDNASGTAGVLEAARVLSQYRFESTIRFIGFNAEEDSMLGSKDYVNNHVIPCGEKIVGMINMDAILRPGSEARPDRPIDVELETMGPLDWVQAFAQAMADYVPSLVLGDIWDYAESGSDNDPFQDAGIPAFLVIENSDGDWYPPNPVANPYIHNSEDASDRLANDPNSPSGVTYDYAFATDIVRAVVALIAQEAILADEPVSKALITIQEVMIPMPDGVNLAADLYMPADIKTGERLPVLLEYIPYRKDENRGPRYPVYSYFVQRGYIVARVDIRGTGNSQGHTIPYEYSDIELNDGEAVIAWLAKQDWSNGNVGMFGISWGGFNSIQMAVRNPPALKAFIAMMATEDLYQEDVHYMDGIMHTDLWMMSHDLYNCVPGAPEFRMDQEWLCNRFELEPSVFTYMQHQRDGTFWDRASTRDKYDQIKIPGFHIGGWYDGYRDSLPRMLENVKAPVKAMIGPWEHCFPHDAWPKPQMEWRHEAVRWFDHWLKGVDTGIMDEPRFAVYVRNWHQPGQEVEIVPGYWRWEEGWPIKRCRWQTLYATPDNGLSSSPAERAIHSHRYKPSIGLEGGGPIVWWGSLVPDQQDMDEDCLVYDSQPIESPLEILGSPRAILNVSADASRANWVVRISDVAPDGSVTQVGGAAFNGTHRKSARQPEDLIPGEVFPLEIEMHFTSWVFPKGHRIRFAVSNAQWPMLWPTPYPMTTTLAIGGTEGAHILLPVIPPSDRPGPKFKPPAKDPSLPGYGTVDSGNMSGYAEIQSVQRNKATGEAVASATNATSYRYPWGLTHFEEQIEHRTSDIDPAVSSVIGTYALVEELENRTIRLEQKVEFKSDLENFHMLFTRRLKVDGKITHEKYWDKIFPRDFQ
jgi:putative CocE/NonD family hydrolase